MQVTRSCGWRVWFVALAVAAPMLVATATPATAAGVPGSLDPSFGDNGVATAPVGTATLASGVIVFSDGSIVQASGRTWHHRDLMTLTKFDATGIVDASFGSGGQVDVAITGAQAFRLPGNRVALVGRTEIALVDADGTPEASFGTGGVAPLPYGGKQFTADWAIGRADGGMYLFGSVQFPGRQYPSPAVAAVDGSGHTVKTFAAGGLRVMPSIFGGFDTAAMTGAGDLVVAGYEDVFDGVFLAGAKLLVVRMQPDGSLDPSFGDSGLNDTAFTSRIVWASSIALRPDRGIVVGVNGYSSVAYADVVTMPAGGHGSDVIVPPFRGEGAIGVLAVTVDAQNRILAVFDSRVDRYETDGTPDPAFGDGGVAEVNGHPGIDDRVAVIVHGDRLLFGGLIRHPKTASPDKAAVARMVL